MLGAFTKEIDIFRLALRALLRNLLNRAAVMALEAIAAFVMRHRDTAVLALHRRATTSAKNGPGISATIDQNQRLRSVAKALFDSHMQRR